MQMIRGGAWHVRFDPVPMLKHAALWVKAVAGVSSEDLLVPPVSSKRRCGENLSARSSRRNG